MNIRIMTSNIWGNCRPQYPISNRDDLLAVVYRRYHPAVIGIQEASPKLRAEETNLFDLSAPEYRELEVDFSPNTNNYTPVLYRPDTVTPVEQGYISLAGLNDGGSKSIVWAVFDTAEGKRFVFINTHYYYTSDEAGCAARVSNSYEMLALVTRLEQKYPETPIIFTGDFNCATADAPIQLLMANGIRETRTEVQDPPVICSYHGYPQPDADGIYRTPEKTNGNVERSIDHVLCKGNVKPLTNVVVDDEEALIGTDHSPVFADFEM